MPASMALLAALALGANAALVVMNVRRSAEAEERMAQRVAGAEQRELALEAEASRQAARRTVVAHVVTLVLSLSLVGAALALERSRRRARLRAQEQERRFQLVAAHSRDIILWMDREGRLLEANAAAAKAYGWSQEELRRLTVHDLRAPGTQAHTAEQMAAADAHGLLFETVHRRRDGSTFPVEVSSQGAGDEGQRTLVSVIRDISARHEAGQALRDSEARLRHLAEALPQLVWTADASGQRTWFNQRWRDYTGQRAGTEDWDPVLHPDDRERVLAVWREAVATGSGFEIEHRLRGQEGGFRWFLRRAVALDAPGVGPGRRTWLGTCTDVHDLKMSQELLRQADKLKQDFLSMASHEFRTPLTAMRLQVEMLRRRLRRPSGQEDERLLRSLSAIEGQIGRLDELLGVLLDVSRINDGKLSLELASVDLGALAREAAERLRPVAESAGSPVRVAASEVRGLWDRARIDQAVTNLLTNAIKYGNARPVDVEVAARDGEAVLTIRDHGIGIPPESRGLLFERFERGANAGVAQGLGLGLWITKKMIDAHGGRIAVESAPGEGSTFTVILPREPARARTQAPPRLAG
ncbi:MAG: PAS domain S-box protein [Anaeromyxobacter sp.]